MLECDLTLWAQCLEVYFLSVSVALPANHFYMLDAQDYTISAVAKTLMWVSLCTSWFGCGCLLHCFVCKPQILIRVIVIG